MSDFRFRVDVEPPATVAGQEESPIWEPYLVVHEIANWEKVAAGN
jgi:hypothetical protein